jgi:hypothetical protein
LSGSDAHLLAIAEAIIAGLRLARDPRTGHKSERVIYAVEDAVFLANEIYDKALLTLALPHKEHDAITQQPDAFRTSLTYTGQVYPAHTTSN